MPNGTSARALTTAAAGKHDDQVDALGLVGQLLDRMVKGTALKPQDPHRQDGYARLFDEAQETNSWRIA